jgi:hypothetical protein
MQRPFDVTGIGVISCIRAMSLYLPRNAITESNVIAAERPRTLARVLGALTVERRRDVAFPSLMPRKRL